MLEQLRAELGDRVEALPADLADRATGLSLAERAGDVDVLVANAALPASGALLDFEPDEIDRALDVNLRAPIQLARALAPAMVERGLGHLVFISSLSGKATAPAARSTRPPSSACGGWRSGCARISKARASA